MTTTPKEMLKDLYWSFHAKYDNQTAFNESLLEYNTRLLKPKPKLEKIVFEETKIAVLFLAYEESADDELEKIIVLETTNPKGFTLSELMFSINNKVVENPTDGIDISEQDAIFFEGLEYLTDDIPGYPQTKVYYMILGS